MKKFNPWLTYEQAKAKLRRLPLTPQEYQEAIRRLAERLGV